MARCVTHAALDMGRADALRRSPLPPEEQGGSGSSHDASLLMVRKAIHDLPARQRDALFLRHYLDFDYAAIAATLGVEVGTVSATLHAARAALRDSLQEVY